MPIDDAQVKAVIAGLIETGRATWPGVGEFEVVYKKARQGMNPQTGAPMTIEARTVVRFVPDEAWQRGESAFRDLLSRSRVVPIPGFGAFELKDYPAYEGRNPKTGEVIHVAASQGVLFRGAPELKEAVRHAPAAVEDEHFG